MEEVDAHGREGQAEEGDHGEDHHPTPPHLGPEPGVEQAGEDQPHQDAADHLGVGPVQPRVARLPQDDLQNQADQQPGRQEREGHGDRPPVQPLGLLQAGQLEAESRRSLVLEPIRLGQVHQPGGERHARADRPDQVEHPVGRPPEPGRPAPARGHPFLPRGPDARHHHQGQDHRQDEDPHRHRLGRPDDQVEPDPRQDPREDQQRLEDRRDRELMRLEREVAEIRRLDDPRQRGQGQRRVPTGLPPDDEPGQVAGQRQPVSPAETEDAQPIHHRDPWPSGGSPRPTGGRARPAPSL